MEIYISLKMNYKSIKRNLVGANLKVLNTKNKIQTLNLNSIFSTILPRENQKSIIYIDLYMYYRYYE